MSQEQAQITALDPRLEVLFVDDEIRVLDGLRRQFRPQRSCWDMRFANSGAEAMQLLSEKHADVVVSDMRMPGMSGSELLTSVQRTYPETIRFVLSGQTDQTELLQNIGCIHQFLQKPCDPDQLIHAISRTHTLISSVESGKLREVVAGIQSLPVISQVHTRLVDAMNSENSNADTAAEIVEEDIGLSVKILQLVNSAFFGMPRQTVSVKDAIVLIGMNNLLNLVMSAHIFDTLGQDIMSKKIIADLWAKSTNIGAMAKKYAKDADQPKDIYNTVCLAGVLSHIGRAIVARTMPNKFKEILWDVERKGCSIREREIEVLGTSQENVGAYALGIWGFSDSIIETVAMQETPTLSMVKDRSHPLFWVHLARSLQGQSTHIDGVDLDEHWACSLGIDEQELNTYRSAA